MVHCLTQRGVQTDTAWCVVLHSVVYRFAQHAVLCKTILCISDLSSVYFLMKKVILRPYSLLCAKYAKKCPSVKVGNESPNVMQWTFRSLLSAYLAAGVAVVAAAGVAVAAVAAESFVAALSEVAGAACSTAGASSAGAAFLLPQEAKDTATITAKNRTNFFIFLVLKQIKNITIHKL
jgi:hypothetical protein